MAGMKDTMVDDVLIAGGGQVGLGLALALKRSAPDMAVTVVDLARPGTGRAGRASTITAGGRKMLERLGVWAVIDGGGAAGNRDGGHR